MKNKYAIRFVFVGGKWTDISFESKEDRDKEFNNISSMNWQKQLITNNTIINLSNVLNCVKIEY